MKTQTLLGLLVGTVIALGACTGGSGSQKMSLTGELPPPGRFVPPTETHEDYLIGPLDKISVRVFGQEKLSVEKAQVDSSGQVALPLIGVVTAAGKTAKNLGEEVASKLGEQYLQSPNVQVLVDEAISQRVTVTGAVIESGVFTLRGPTSLVQAISMAKGADIKLADLKQVAIIRTINGKRARGVFDVISIRDGKSDDPQVYGGDIIVVSTSQGKSAWRELVGVLPGLGIFAYF